MRPLIGRSTGARQTMLNAMNRSPAYPSAARAYAGFGRQHPIDSIEWEALPSLVDALRRNQVSSTGGSVWNSAEPLGFQPMRSEAAPESFVEVLAGLHMREITGDEVFRHFFGYPRTH
jgi:hypothetical protein